MLEMVVASMFTGVIIEKVCFLGHTALSSYYGNLRKVLQKSKAWGETSGCGSDLVRSIALPDDDDDDDERRSPFEDEGRREDQGVRLREQETSEERIPLTSNPSTATAPMLVVSPNVRVDWSITHWKRGRLLGEGSFGVVYEGICHDGFSFAVKQVSLLRYGSMAKKCLDALRQEIKLLSQIEHENIVQYYGTSEDEESLFIFIELVPEGSLSSLYQKYQLLDSQVSAYTRQILNGLNYLHACKVVHRDIKCDNILVHANGFVKLADFGLAKQIINSSMHMTRDQGTVRWMAPEVMKSEESYGRAADIWSLGCTVLEMLTRQVPYPGLKYREQVIFQLACNGFKPPIPSDLSVDAHDFINQCLQVNPADRPSASQLLEHPFVKSPLKN